MWPSTKFYSIHGLWVILAALFACCLGIARRHRDSAPPCPCLHLLEPRPAFIGRTSARELRAQRSVNERRSHRKANRSAIHRSMQCTHLAGALPTQVWRSSMTWMPFQAKLSPSCASHLQWVSAMEFLQRVQSVSSQVAGSDARVVTGTDLGARVHQVDGRLRQRCSFSHVTMPPRPGNCGLTRCREICLQEASVAATRVAVCVRACV